MEVVVLGGGNSPERDVSLRSAKAVSLAARQAGFDVVEIDPADISNLAKLKEGSIVLPILHGAGGEDGTIQAELEKRNIPYLGSDSVSSAKSFDKWQTRTELEKANLPIAEGYLVKENTYYQNELSGRPHVLKVPHGGSSIGTLVVRDPSRTDKAKIEQIFSMETEVVLEELIIGAELTVPILDQTALTPLEIIPPEGDEFDYENKYNGQTQELCPPVSVSDEVQSECQELAEKVHKIMNCRHLSRVDIMIGNDGRLIILEINTIPGLTDQSLYPKSAAAAGMNMPKLVTRFIELVKRDYHL